ncbi:hypothetical protein DPMN_076410 [Dreissena polymorpha]|uniref:Uncharacterized protein n=1 Tax=Dreissena polymorpha TaxID=45954 RepID=A0A9D3YMB3_DREPO|nr:hypothetical protein DPMN_076410 [Dreissena polymorpha]
MFVERSVRAAAWVRKNILIKFHHYWTNSMASIYLRIVNARVFTNQKWTDGRRKKTDPKTSSEQSVMSIYSKPKRKSVTDRLTDRLTDRQTNRQTNRRTLRSLYALLRGIKMRVFTRFLYSLIKKTAPPPGGHFHDDWAKNHVFQRTGPIFELYSLSTKKTAPQTGGHVFQRTETTFKPNQHIIKTNISTNDLLLTKFHEDRTRNVASIVFTNKCGRTNGQTTDKRPITKAHLSNQRGSDHVVLNERPKQDHAKTME